MKALILAGGRGKRINDVTQGHNKCMMHINGKHAIEYSLDCAVATEIDEIVIVVGYRAEEIINYIGTEYKGRKVQYVIQWEQRGLVHAMEISREALGSDDFILLLGDEIMTNPRHQAMIDIYKSEGVFALCGVLKVHNRDLIKRTYTFIQDVDNTIYRLVEKPRNPFNNFMGTGDCVFNNKIFDYIEVTPIHHQRNEKELPDLIQCAIDDCKIVKSFNICDHYANINSEDDISIAESLFADRLEPASV